ncbi:MAG: glycosyltransferase, partial [Candidatus Methanomethyliaceae archaeon]
SPLPRLRAYEVSFPAKLVEYLAAGKAVVASDITAHQRIICHEWNGMLFPPGDDTALSSAIKQLYYSRQLRVTLSKNARKTAEAYGWNEILEQLEEKLSQIMPRLSVGIGNSC